MYDYLVLTFSNSKKIKKIFIYNYKKLARYKRTLMTFIYVSNSSTRYLIVCESCMFQKIVGKVGTG